VIDIGPKIADVVALIASFESDIAQAGQARDIAIDVIGARDLRRLVRVVNVGKVGRGDGRSATIEGRRIISLADVFAHVAQMRNVVPLSPMHC
jgi:hypothetical protein